MVEFAPKEPWEAMAERRKARRLRRLPSPGFTRRSRILPGARKPDHVPHPGPEPEDRKFPSRHVPDPAPSRVPLSSPEDRPDRPHQALRSKWPTGAPCLASFDRAHCKGGPSPPLELRWITALLVLVLHTRKVNTANSQCSRPPPVRRHLSWVSQPRQAEQH